MIRVELGMEVQELVQHRVPEMFFFDIPTYI